MMGSVGSGVAVSDAACGREVERGVNRQVGRRMRAEQSSARHDNALAHTLLRGVLFMPCKCDRSRQPLTTRGLWSNIGGL